MKNLAAPIILGVLLLGCAGKPAVISAINDSSLEVQTGLGTTDRMINQEAKRGCGIYDKKPVEISHRCLDQYCWSKSILFACQ